MTIIEHGTPTQAVIIPTVTMRQARLALLGAGLLSSVDAAIAAMSEPTKSQALIAWEYSPTVERHSPWLIQIAAPLSLTDAQIDDLFVAAAALA